MNLWDMIFVNPMINALIWFYSWFGQSYVLAILITTAITRLIILPVTMRQQKSMASMQELQPELKKLQEKYENDPEQLNLKMMELYKEKGVNPLGGCFPMLIQMPILIAFWQAITRSLASTPLHLIDLSQRLYHNLPAWIPDAQALIPLRREFLWLNLGTPDPYYVIPVILFITTFIQGRMMTPPPATKEQAAQTQMMAYLSPVMITFISFNLPSGVSIYYIVSSVIGFIQYAAMGKASLKNLYGTEDGSFSLRGLLGFPPPEEPKATRQSSSRRRRDGKDDTDKSKK